MAGGVWRDLPGRIASSGGRWIFLQRRQQFGIGRIFLLLRIHEFAVAFLVPPGVAEVRIHEEITLVHVAGDALAGRDRTSEAVVDGMAALVLGNGRIAAEAETLVAELAVIIRI